MTTTYINITELKGILPKPKKTISLADMNNAIHKRNAKKQGFFKEPC